MYYSKKNIFIGLLLLYSILGFIFIPYFFKLQLVNLVEKNTTATVTIENVSFNPFVFSLKLNQVTFRDAQNNKLLSFELFNINIEPSSLFYGAVHIKTIKLSQPKIFLKYNKDKTINLLNSLSLPKSKDKESQTSTTLPRIIVDKIKIEEGSLEYLDYTRKELFKFSFEDIGFSLKNIDTTDMNVSDAQVRLYTTLSDGGFLDFNANVHSLKPFRVDGSIKFEASKLYTQWKYLKEELALEVADGKVFFELDYMFNSEDLNATVIQNLNLSLKRLRIISKDEHKNILSLDKLNIKNVEIKPFIQKINIEKISLDDLRIEAKRNKNMNINLFSFVNKKPDTNVEATNTVTPWNVNIIDIALEKIKINFLDEGIRPSVNANLDEINLYANNIYLQSKKKSDDKLLIIIEDANISLNDFLLVKQASKEKLFTFKEFNINNIRLNTKTKRIEIEETLLKNFNVYVRRYKNKHLNIDSFLKTEKKTKSIPPVAKEEPFNIILNKFSLINGGISFKDSSLEKTHTQKIDKINFQFYKIDSKKRSWLTYNGKFRLNKKGRLYLKGKLRHTPLKQLGNFELKDLNLQFLNPYLKEKTHLRLSDGKLSFKGKSKYMVSSKKADLQITSQFALNSFRLNDIRDKSLLLYVNKLQTNSINLELFPNRLYVDEVKIDGFYMDAKIDENQTINYAKLMKPVVNHEKVKTKEASKEVFPIKILKLVVSEGSAKFSDFSIPIKFSTNIHNMHGVIYSISNTKNETTSINISGDVDEYGLTKLKGSVDSSNPKSYTDLNLNFQNLELNSLSGYASSSVGHEIESGKLYLDLGYKIVNSQLNASNTIVMKNVVLGEESKDENVTVLPLGFLLGLLEDSDGVVDIEMPIEGNINEPDFKYGALILKTIGRLIVKAVTSPFRFLGEVMGIDTSALEDVYFESGMTLVTPPQREKLDTLAKMMLKKPKINLTLQSSYDTRQDKQAVQMNKLIDLVLQKSGLQNRKEHVNAMTTDLLKDIYEEVQSADDLEKLREKLALDYSGEVLERMFHEELIVMCRNIQVVSTQELIDLANNRVNNIYTYLSEDKMISKSRLIIKEVISVKIKKGEPVSVHIEIEIK